MATVTIQRRPRQDGASYNVSFRDPQTGVKKHYKTFRKKAEADLAANELRSLIDLGRIPEVRKGGVRPLTVVDVAASLRTDWERKGKTGELRSATLEAYYIHLDRLIRDRGRVLMCRFQADDVLDYRAELAGSRSNVLANRVLFVLKQLFKKGLAMGAIHQNPTAGIHYLSEKEHCRKRFLQPRELSRLLEAAEKTRAKYYLPALIMLGAEHGASKQECLGLTWGKIDLDSAGPGLIQLHRTKNARDRGDLLMPRTREALLRWREHLRKNGGGQAAELNPDAPVFCRLDGKPLAAFRTAFAQARRIAKISNFRFHDLRHTFCSNLLLSGAGIKDVSELIGHADIKTTNRYSHLTVEHRHGLLKALDRHYRGGADGEGRHVVDMGLKSRKKGLGLST